MANSNKANKAEEQQEPKGLYNVTFEKELGKNEKGAKVKMHYTTAKALEKKGFVKLGSPVKNYKPVAEQ